MLIREQPHLVVSFEGGDADEQQMRTYEMGTALIGIDRLITTGLFRIATGGVPGPRAPQPFVIRTSTLRDGCIEIPLWLATTTVASLALVRELCVSGASEVLWRWMSGVLMRLAGRDKEANDHISQLIAALREVNVQRHAELVKHIEGMQWSSFARYGAQTMAPVGRSCRYASLSGDQGKTVFDSYDGESIRANAQDRMGPMEALILTIDGFTHHNRQLRVVDPECPGRYVPAHVRDPAFDIIPNVYTEAATRRAELRVMAKTARHKATGTIRAFFILDTPSPEG